MKCAERERQAIVVFLSDQQSLTARSVRERAARAQMAREELVRRTLREPRRAVVGITERLTPHQRKHPLVQQLLSVAAEALLRRSPDLEEVRLTQARW